MPRIPGTTDAQSSFLRAFRKTPSGPPPEDWPSHIILARWLKQPRFLEAWNALHEVLQFEAQLRIDVAESHAAGVLAQKTAVPPTDPLERQDLDRAVQLLRTAHLRDRFGPTGLLR